MRLTTRKDIELEDASAIPPHVLHRLKVFINDEDVTRLCVTFDDCAGYVELLVLKPGISQNRLHLLIDDETKKPVFKRREGKVHVDFTGLIPASAS